MNLRFAFPLAAALSIFVTGCPSPDTPVDPITPEEPTACERTSDCPVEQVCDAIAGVCVDELSCAEHSDCGVDAYCDDGTCARSTTGVACDTDDDCYAGDACFAGHCGCAGESIAAEPVAPNVMVVLDRSGSMNDSGGSDSKWNLATAAVQSMVTTYREQIRFGLVLYNNGAECGAGDVDVAVSDDSMVAIADALDASSPRGKTPIGATLDALTSEPSLQETGRSSSILLVTDGEESCGGDAAAAAGALYSAPHAVRTFAVGFGDGVDSESLNSIAEAGHTDAGIAGNRYYQADDASQLEAAFEEIADSVIGCSFQLPDAPANASQLFVYLDGEEIAQDDWTYDAATEQLTLVGSACQSLQATDAGELSFARGCPAYVP